MECRCYRGGNGRTKYKIMRARWSDFVEMCIRDSSYHTQGEVIYWQFLDYLPARSEEIGRAFAAASGYELAETPYESSFAGYKDWFIQRFDRPGYTIEAGRGESPLPLSQFPEIYADNVGILTLGMSLAQ